MHLDRKRRPTLASCSCVSPTTPATLFVVFSIVVHGLTIERMFSKDQFGVRQGLLRHSAAVKRTAKGVQPNGRNDGEGQDGAGGLAAALPRSWRRRARRRSAA